MLMWLLVSSAAVLGTLLRCNAFFTSFSSSSGYTNLSLGSPRPPLSKGLKLSMNILKQGAPVLGFYAVMLAPIYGVGFLSGIVPGLGFGTITDFSQLRNRAPESVVANEYILCSPKVCPKARAVQPREYDIPAEDLIARMDKVVLTQPRITVIDKFTKDTPLKKEYVQRSLIFQWPDVITIEAIPLEEKKSTLAIHSYSIYGAGDLGVNGNRVRSWVGLLEDDINDVVRK